MLSPGVHHKRESLTHPKVSYFVNRKLSSYSAKVNTSFRGGNQGSERFPDTQVALVQLEALVCLQRLRGDREGAGSHCQVTQVPWQTQSAAKGWPGIFRLEDKSYTKVNSHLRSQSTYVTELSQKGTTGISPHTHTSPHPRSEDQTQVLAG